MKRTQAGPQRGSVLIAATMVMAALVSFTVPYLSILVAEYRMSERSEGSALALHVAEAAAERALWELNYGPGSWSGWTDDGFGNKLLGDTLLASLGNPAGDYSVSVTNPTAATVTIDATGFVPDQTDLWHIERRVTVLVEAQSVFDHPLFGESKVVLNGGSSTDSYDASVGPYDPGTAGSNGDVGSNQEIVLNGDSTVDGNATSGGTVELNGDSEVTGTTTEGTGAVSLPPIDFADYDVNNDNTAIGLTDNGDDPLSGDDLSLNGGDNLNLNSGLYYFTDIALNGDSSLTILGPVQIYCNGDADLNGGTVINLASQVPGDFLLYASGDVAINGDSTFYGGVYAPTGKITLNGNGESFGSLVGNEVDLNGGANFHYDEALGGVGPSLGYQVVWWQQK